MKKESAIIVMVVIASLIFLIGEAVRGEENSDGILLPCFLIQGQEGSEDHFPLKSTDVMADISGVIADVTVRQIYENMGPHPINVRYIFPASTRAAVHGMTMVIGNKIIRARVKEKVALTGTGARTLRAGL